MNPLDNRYERNPALFRDMPENLFEDQGTMRVIFYDLDGDGEFACLLHFEYDGRDFTVDCSKVKNVWSDGMREDLINAIDAHFKQHFFLSRKDLNLNIIGL